jgi:hypothetical protein
VLAYVISATSQSPAEIAAAACSRWLTNDAPPRFDESL